MGIYVPSRASDASLDVCHDVDKWMERFGIEEGGDAIVTRPPSTPAEDDAWDSAVAGWREKGSCCSMPHMQRLRLAVALPLPGAHWGFCAGTKDGEGAACRPADRHKARGA